MKPSPFSWHPVRSVEQAVAALAALSPEGGRILAGGQSLLPMMAFRLAQPTHLIDINAIPGLDRWRWADAALCIPACVRHAAFERTAFSNRFGALLAEVARHIAHHPIRTRGTFCGSVANADPSSEWCLAAVAFDAAMVLESAGGQRLVAADDFFRSAMTTALREDEMLLETRLRAPPDDMRFGFSEHSRRAGDYAQSMALAGVRVVGGVVAEALVALGGAETRPRRLRPVETLLINAAPDAQLAARAAAAAADMIDPMVDGQVSASLRRNLARATTRRALLAAFA